jgi:hypothetical protein
MEYSDLTSETEQAVGDLQAPAYPGGDRRLRVPSTEPSLGPFWDKAITVSALTLGLLGLGLSLHFFLDEGRFSLGLTVMSAGYFAGGLLNAYLSALWRRSKLGFRARLTVMILKPIVILYLIVAVVVACLLFVTWVLFPKPWDS